MKVKWFVILGASLIMGVTKGNALQSGWEKTGNLARVTAVYTLGYDDSGNIYAGTELPGDIGVVFKSQDKGESWELTGDLPGVIAVFSIIQASDGALYCGTMGGGGVFKSINYGDTWVPTGELPETPQSVYCLLQGKDDAIYAGAAYKRAGTSHSIVFKSTNKGETWEITGPMPGGGIRSLLEIPDGTIYAGNIVGAETTAYVFKSTNGGDSWEKTGKLLADKVAGIMSLFYADGVIYAGTVCIDEKQGLLIPKVFKSSDMGSHWISLREMPLDGGEGVWGLIKTKKGILYAGTAWGFAGAASRKGKGKIFESSDDMRWTLSDSFPESNGVSSFIQTSDSIIYAGITGSGITGAVYKNISEAGIEEKENLLPLSVQTHPNPTTKLTVIRFQLPVKTVVNLKVYDISGRAVRNLTRTQSLEPGAYTVEWNGTDEKGKEAPAGVYFIELKTQRNRETKKIVKID